MEKFYLKSGKEVKMGDNLVKYSKENTPFKKILTMEQITVNEHTLPKLIEMGVLTLKKECTAKTNCSNKQCVENKVPMVLDYYLQKIGDKLGMDMKRTCEFMDNIKSVCVSASFSMLLKEIAIELDKKYKDHIEESPEIYVISTLDGRISEVNKACIKNYKNFAAFRSMDDAKIACRILKPVLKEMFKSKGGE